MSYDVHLEIDTGGPKSAMLVDLNYTSNVAAMWEKALGHPLGDLSGTVARSAIDPLRKAIARMEDHSAEYAQMDPPNGWGDSEGAREFLEKLKHACIAHPKATIRVSH